MTNRVMNLLLGIIKIIKYKCISIFLNYYYEKNIIILTIYKGNMENNIQNKSTYN